MIRPAGRINRAKPSLRTPIILLALILGGCARLVPSTDLPLSKMSFQISVLARSGSEAEVWVSIRPGRRMAFRTQRVEMVGGDRLVAEVDGKSYELKAMSEPNHPLGYGVKVSTATPEARVRILLMRLSQPVVPIATGTLPPPFELAELPRSPSASRPLEVRWAPVSSEPMEIDVKGSCLSRTTIWLREDPGHAVVEAGLLRPPVFKWDDCQVDLTVARAGEGRPERGLHPGSGLLIRQVRTARLEPVR
ncbi:MAG: hypothetical protein QOH06_3997 [Acidobacteriota bacterium]|jgi:hypothetical protein|nr:hypothetical protein [Acidobacteriota bacterium]